MSEVRAESFFNLYARGEVSADEIDDFVGRWHDDQELWAKRMPLHEYLGLTWPEYQIWVYDADALPLMLAARREQRPLEVVMAERLDALVRARREVDGTTIHGLRVWLASRDARTA